MSGTSVALANRYAPLGVVTDGAELGFVRTTVRGAAGTAVARHRPQRTSTRATIFLHGAAGSWSTWSPMLAVADRDGLVVTNPVILDLPGWGEATPPADAPTLTIDAVCELVRDTAYELGYTEWDLVGHSLGGFIALHMASIWPQSVLSVALVSGTTYSVIDGVGRPWRGLAELPGFVLLLWFMRLLAPIEPLAMAALRGIRALGLLRLAAAPLFRHPMRVHASVIDALSRELRPRSFVTAAEVARHYDADARWSAIECEVRAMKGDRDVFVTNRDLRRLSQTIPRITVAVLPDCGHFGNVERPAETLALLGFAAS